MTFSCSMIQLCNCKRRRRWTGGPVLIGLLIVIMLPSTANARIPEAELEQQIQPEVDRPGEFNFKIVKRKSTQYRLRGIKRKMVTGHEERSNLVIFKRNSRNGIQPELKVVSFFLPLYRFGRPINHLKVDMYHLRHVVRLHI